MASPHLAFLDLGAPELIIILVILLLLFGSKKLPDLTRSLGESMRELRKGFNDNSDEKPETKSDEKPETKKPPQDQDHSTV